MTDKTNREKDPIKSDFIDRLHHARRKIDELKSKPKLDAHDRAIFARNLGRLFEKVVREDSTYNYAKLFTSAFNDMNISESLQKKRKTLILHQYEATNSNGLAASPHKYLKLTETLDKHYRTLLDAPDGVGYLYLLENSSFDFQNSLATRVELEQRSQLKQVLIKCVELVRGKSDLRQMDQWLQNTSLNTKGGTGIVQEIGPFRYSDGLRALMRYDLEERLNNAIAPCVRLQSLTKELQPEVIFKLPVSDNDYSRSAMISTLDRFLTETNFLERLEMESFDDYSSLANLNKACDQLRTTLANKNLLLSQLPVQIGVRKYFDLEILFHQELNEWLPYIIERYDISRNDRCYDENFKVTTLYSEQTDLFYLGELFGDQEYELFGFRFESHSGENYFGYFLKDVAGLEKDYTYPMSYPYVPFSEEFYSLMFGSTTALSGWSVSNKFEVPSVSISSLPTRTLGHDLIANVLYAHDQHKVTNRLVADAEYKFNILKSYIEKNENDYEERLSSFLTS